MLKTCEIPAFQARLNTTAEWNNFWPVCSVVSSRITRPILFVYVMPYWGLSPLMQFSMSRLLHHCMCDAVGWFLSEVDTCPIQCIIIQIFSKIVWSTLASSKQDFKQLQSSVEELLHNEAYSISRIAIHIFQWLKSLLSRWICVYGASDEH